MPKTYIVPAQALQRVLDYLQSKPLPWVEVNPLLIPLLTAVHEQRQAATAAVAAAAALEVGERR